VIGGSPLPAITNKISMPQASRNNGHHQSNRWIEAERLPAPSFVELLNVRLVTKVPATRAAIPRLLAPHRLSRRRLRCLPCCRSSLSFWPAAVYRS